MNLPLLKLFWVPLAVFFLAQAEETAAQGKKLKVFEGSWEQLVALAQEQNRPILVEVYAPWCGYCKKLEKTTLKDKVVAEYVNNRYLFVKIDAENATGVGPEFVKKFGIQGFPAIMVLNPDQTMVGRFSGYRDPQKFIASLQKIEKPVQ